VNDLHFIQLTDGSYTVIDAEDQQLARAYRWMRHHTGSGNYYAANTTAPRTGRVYLHRLVMGEPASHVDHISRDKMVNCKANLRACTCAQNLSNRGKTAMNTSGYKGVDWVKRISTWRAQIGVRGARLFLGHFTDPVAAARAYDAAARRLHGEFALTNFPEETT